MSVPCPPNSKAKDSSNGYGPILKCGMLMKRSVIKRKAFQTQNYKRRLFELTENSLAYFDGDIHSKGKQKGVISLKCMKVVAEVDDRSLEDKCNVFQIVYAEKDDFCTLYIVADSIRDRQTWIDAIRAAALKVETKFFEKYHPGVWTKKRPFFDCCHQSDRNAIGCKHDALSLPDLDLRAPEPPPRPERAPAKAYIAMYDYEPTDESGLELIEGEQYTILDDSAEHWWFAENRQGEKGFIPSNYIKKNFGLEVFEWYYKDCSREYSKTLLMNSKQDGCFLIRDSTSFPGEYTLSLYTTEQGGNVRHYQIKRDESGLFYISKDYPHSSIPDLIHYHKHNPGGLYTRLRNPPPRGNKPQTAGFAHGKWSLDPKLLTIGKELGRGNFGVVHEGLYRNGPTQLPVAIKKMTVKPSSDEVLQEYKTMTFLAHPNLVQLYGIILDENQSPQMIITELLHNGDLNKYLQTNRQILFYNPNKLLDFGIQVCRGMEYLDKRNIIHRDLAARNCLVGSDTVIKIGDFGLARTVLEDDTYQMSEGTKFPFKWAPPEVLYHRRFSSKSDVWAYGILLWEIYSLGEMPYSGMKNPEVLKYVAEQGKRLNKPRLANNYHYEIMKRCWNADPLARPTFSTLRTNLESLTSRSDYIFTEMSR
ncbi:tyrosine-protein kinase [Plakobranchus ocellatus]|uniref:Tyrosine-protein kinase n=1 Tax=Plakobranchus ocellatus TaxID=259542 RepID=A0AAV3ZPU3_9GAST|nr:tyrosine-protein kinase [Plakobranchus ocellatus]